MLAHPFKIYSVLLFCIASFSCTPDKKQQQEALFNQYCTNCHLAPSLDALPKHFWQEKVLPEMAARIGIRDSTNDPYRGLSLSEQGAILKTGVYPSNPIIKKEDWNLLQDYILENAPDSITEIPKRNLEIMTQFDAEVITIDSISGSNISYLNYNADSNKLYCGSLRGNLVSYDFSSKNVSHVLRAGTTITHFSQFADTTFLTTIGFLLPSELPVGDLGIKEGAKIRSLPQKLHRPVHTSVNDLNNDGNKELIISEFGDLKGQLSLWSKNKSGHYIESVLRSQPGTTRTIVQDLNNDGKDDIIALASQGDENIEIFFQKDNLEFYGERVLRFPPQFGTSWFELVDFNNDGFLDIITTNGDNADETYTMKSYHGVRIHLNNGQNQFEESFFYPMNGCTRVIADDFDQDQDIDLVLLSTFPDYKNHSDESFVYLENTTESQISFKPYRLSEPNMGRWFLMDTGDFDNDGDLDLVLSSLTYTYSPVPQELDDKWKNENVDLLLLKNNLY